MENILVTKSSADYELIDSGDGEKLERYGKVVLSRPDPQVLWSRSAPEKWKSADAVYTRSGTSGKWKILKEIPEPWRATFGGITFALKLQPSKHLGVFPEQSAQWAWLSEKVKKEISSRKKISVLNLFGYSGGATLACAKAGAEVCHVDSSEFAVDLAHQNAVLSGLDKKPIRFIVDDARKFVEREIKRGNKYDIVLLDPPVYGKGVKNEVWRIEKDLAPLLLRLKQILSPKPIAVVLNGYASGYSHTTYAQILETMTKDLNGKISSGQLTIEESDSKRVLPCGIFARFES